MPQAPAARSILVATGFPPMLGGIETLLYQTNRRLPYAPLVLAPHPAAAPDMAVRPVLTTPGTLAGRAAYRAQWVLHPSLHYLASFWRPALDAVRKMRPDVLQCGHVYLAPLTWLLARRFRRPLVLYAHGQEVSGRGQGVGVAAVDRLLRGGSFRRADAILTHSRYIAGLVQGWSADPARIVRVPFGAEPRPPIEPPRGMTLLTVCRLIPLKGVDTVLRALPAVARVCPSVEYRVVGDGPHRPTLEALARSLGVAERVHFLGRQVGEALDREYRRCALFVQVSRPAANGAAEGYGLVYFEAASWGRPALAGMHGGEADAVVDGVTGRLVDGTSVEQVGAAIADLLSAPEQLRCLGAAGRQRVETTHNWQRAAATVGDVLRLVAQGREPI